MEGLHHDTILDSDKDITITEDGKSVEEDSAPNAKNNVSEKDFSQSSANISLSKEEKIFLFEQMVRIRRFEERSLRSYQQGHIGGFLHLYIGQEAVAVGSVSMMGKDDHVITAYRDHGHALAVGMDFDECMAELYGKKTGCSKGKGGSMHFFAPDKNYWYRGHSVADPDQTYRSKEEIEEYKLSKDPINLFRAKLIDEKTASEDQLKEIDNKAKDDAEASAQFADASPNPQPAELMDDIYWETDNPEKKQSLGTMFFETP